VAKRKNGNHKKKTTISVMVVAGFIPGVTNLHRAYQQRIHGQSTALGDLAVEASRIFMGFDPRAGVQDRFNLEWFGMGGMPVILGALAHKIAGRLGINRMLARAGVPFIRI